MAIQHQIKKFGLYGEGSGGNDPEFVHIERIPTRSKTHRWQISPHLHPELFQLLFLREGRGRLITEGAERQLPPNTLVVIPRGCVHAFRFDPKVDGWIVSIADALLDDPRLIYGDYRQTVRGDNVLTIAVEEEGGEVPLLYSLFEGISARHNKFASSRSDSLIATIGLLLSITGELSAQNQLLKNRPLDRRLGLFRRFSALVEESAGLNKSVPDYAHDLGTTAATLTRTCNQIGGLPPAQIILNSKVRQAKQSLSFTDASIGMIAQDLGFSDHAYFARVFKQQTGKTASAFRQQYFWRISAQAADD